MGNCKVIAITNQNGGFYDIACELKPMYKSIYPKEVRSRELQLTRECTDWSPLLSYLGEKTSIQEKTQTEKQSRSI